MRNGMGTAWNRGNNNISCFAFFTCCHENTKNLYYLDGTESETWKCIEYLSCRGSSLWIKISHLRHFSLIKSWSKDNRQQLWSRLFRWALRERYGNCAGREPTDGTFDAWASPWRTTVPQRSSQGMGARRYTCSHNGSRRYERVRLENAELRRVGERDPCEIFKSGAGVDLPSYIDDPARRFQAPCISSNVLPLND